MTLLEYLTSHPRGETIRGMLLELQESSMAGHEPFQGLPMREAELLAGLRALKAEGKAVETWPPGATEGVWRVASAAVKKPQQAELFG